MFYLFANTITLRLVAWYVTLRRRRLFTKLF